MGANGSNFLYTGEFALASGVAMCSMSAMGILANGIAFSFFIRKQKKELGNKLIIALNLCDLVICIFSAAAIPPFNKMNQDNVKLALLVREANETNAEIYAPFIEAFRGYISLAVTWQAALFFPSQFLVQVSCVLTVLLCTTRMIAVKYPLYTVRQKTVWIGFVIIVIILLGMTTGKIVPVVVSLPGYTDESIMETLKTKMMEVPAGYFVTMYILMAETLLIGILVLVAIVCSGVTVQALKSPVVHVEGANGPPNNSNNNRATTMILLLSLVFVVVNGTWITIVVVTHFDFFVDGITVTTFGESEKKYVLVTFINLVMLPANSIINPLIYIARNTGLNEHVRMSLRRPLRGILQETEM